MSLSGVEGGPGGMVRSKSRNRTVPSSSMVVGVLANHLLEGFIALSSSLFIICVGTKMSLTDNGKHASKVDFRKRTGDWTWKEVLLITAYCTVQSPQRPNMIIPTYNGQGAHGHKINLRYYSSSWW